MIHTTPPAQEQSIASLFDSPIAQLYAAQDNFKEDAKRVKEMEHDYPAEVLELLETARNLSDQIKEAKGRFLEQLECQKDYIDARNQRASSKVRLDNIKLEIKSLAIDKSNGEELTLHIPYDGGVIQLATRDETKVYLDGKELV